MVEIIICERCGHIKEHSKRFNKYLCKKCEAMEAVETEDFLFKGSGLLWFVNTILHAFGWVLTYRDGVYKPHRTHLRGFPESVNTEHYKRLEEHFFKQQNQNKTIVLCGSTKFKNDFIRVNKELTLQGYIVLSVGLFGHLGDAINEEQKIQLDELHKRKIDLADEVYIINKNGYIGDSTKSEIAYAIMRGKTIRYMEENNIPLSWSKNEE